MKRSIGRLLIACLVLLCGATTSRGADAFLDAVDVAPIRTLSLQHNQTIKTFDSYARESLFHITGRSKLEGREATVAVLDMILSPQAYYERNLIYVRNKPFRSDFSHVPGLNSAEQERIIKEGTISLRFWIDPKTRKAMQDLMASATVKAKAIQEIDGQASMLGQILDIPHFRGTFFSQAIVPPEGAKSANEKQWMSLPDASMHLLQHAEGHTPAELNALTQMVNAIQTLAQGWHDKNAVMVNRAAADLASGAVDMNPTAYPSETKRKFEVFYNSLYRLTWPGAALYFLAFVSFLIAWRAELKWMYIGAWVFTAGAVLVHGSAIAIRWWLVEKSVGDWFHAIPIKNQFESVMFSAAFGTLVALVLESGLMYRALKLVGYESRKLHGMGIFGVAGAGIGLLSLVALFTVPFVTRQDIIGAGIRQNAGILMTYWLYIHVTLVTASYALIGMTFVIGVWYVIQYVFNRDAAILQTLDSANVTMLQLAFWILAVGIITGALWADVSWGRPWGWDPKETFALITWIVYLIIVHVRFVTAGTKRALVTSVLSVIGFAIMLFNWIGVNFFLVGLHSYA